MRVLFADQKVPISRKNGVFAFDLEGVKMLKDADKVGSDLRSDPYRGGGQRSRIDRSIARQCLVNAPIEM